MQLTRQSTRTTVTHWLLISFIAILAGITYWLLQINLSSMVISPPTRPKPHMPDYFADHFSITMLDKTGTTQYWLNAEKLIHYQDDGNTEVNLPTMHALMRDQPEVTSFAKRGTINSDGSVIDLYEDARILRAPGQAELAIQASSQHFRIRVNDHIVQTESPVKLQQGPSLVTADGMIYNYETRMIQFIDQVRGVIAESVLSKKQGKLSN